MGITLAPQRRRSDTAIHMTDRFRAQARLTRRRVPASPILCKTEGVSAEETHEVPIRDESIRLGQLLKLAGVVENGALAREVIEAGAVSIGGEVEDRRGRQVGVGETVMFDGEEFGLPTVELTPVQE